MNFLSKLDTRMIEPMPQLQKQVLSVYRSALRTARTKPDEERKMIENIAKAELTK